MEMKYSIFALLFVCSLGIFNITHSQTFDQSQTTINMEIFPEIPGPNDEVYVSLASYATDINSATIVWKLNGKVQKQGIGERDFSFVVGNMNTKTVLSVTIRTIEGENIEKSITIKPSDVDIIWQSQSFVPPFYKGKAMFSHQNQITFIAIPHITGSNGQEINNKNLIYKWRKNGTVIEDVSGFAKNTYTFTGPLISRPLQVSVEVSSVNNDGVAFGQTYIEPGEPSIVFYRKDPIYGIKFEKALTGTFELNNSKEITVIGIPLFFGVLDPAFFALNYKWLINGVSVGNDSSANTQVFRQKEGTSGSSKISLNIENSDKILQYASEDFNLKFNNNSNE